MNITKLIAAAAILTATVPAFAAEWVEFSDFVSTKTRAEVAAELRMAQADGSYAASNSEIAGIEAPMASTARSRADVRAEAIEAAKHQTSSVRDTYFGG